MTPRAIPPDILTQHVAVLGKTGSGKTSTAKLAIEQVVGDNARVCVLDPIKSDWWGLTSSPDGKRAGLPFHILGGPRGHVPLHASAGKAIAEIVASGALPLSIIDMADFEPGGQAKFFTEFAPALLKRMRGVVYLVIEEAHLFAPKERSGVGAENLSIHWSKTLATAGRSKGVRLIVLSQRVQALHNAVLGSCDTLIAHRLTAPADQKPIVDWLKANAPADVMREVSGSLSSLKTGEGWVCSGESRIFERRKFPRIHTYDNTATPVGDGEARVVKTAPVDQDKLRTIIGEAVQEAEANDPKVLRRRVVELEQTVRRLEQRAQAPKTGTAEVKTVEVEVLTDADRELLRSVAAAGATLTEDREKALMLQEAAEHMKAAIDELIAGAGLQTQKAREVFAKRIESARFQRIVDKVASAQSPAAVRSPAAVAVRMPGPVSSVPVHRSSSSGGDLEKIGKMGRAILTVLAQHGPSEAGRLTLLSGYRYSGGFKNSLTALRNAGYMVGDNTGVMEITEAGRAALGEVDDPPTGPELARYWLNHRSFGTMARAILAAIIVEGKQGLTADKICERTGYAYSGGFKNALTALRTAGVIVGKNTDVMRASEALL
jgi:hypothetical protein